MWSWSNILTPWDVKQYVYCPMIPWVAWNYNIREPETYSMIRGREERDTRLKRLRDLGIKTPLRFDVEMYSPKYRIAGIVDAISGMKKYSVIEIKKFKRKKFSHFRAQLFSYALLSEECFGPTPYAKLVLGKRVKEWYITVDELKNIIKIIKRTREIIEREKPPLVQRSRKCYSCWYRRYCPLY